MTCYLYSVETGNTVDIGVQNRPLAYNYILHSEHMRGWQGASNYVHVFDFEGIFSTFRIKIYPSGVVSVDMIACVVYKAVA